MAEDMSDIINNLSNMIKEDKIPDNIKQLLNNVGNNGNSNDVSSSGSSNISPEMLSNLASMFSGNSNSSDNGSSTSNSNSSTPNIDMETILKMKSIMEKMNSKDDPRSNLLMSLKPYLKDSRKDKVEQYVKLFNMSKVIDVFNLTGGEKNK